MDPFFGFDGSFGSDSDVSEGEIFDFLRNLGEGLDDGDSDGSFDFDFDQIGGYGGFGYDTSHVPPDEREPEIVRLAHAGFLTQIKELVDKIKIEKDRRLLFNASKRWTEVDYKMSGFTKEHEWNALTPLATASRYGHVDIVRYLLEMGIADPTLRGCPSDDVYFDTFTAVEDGLKMVVHSPIREHKEKKFKQCKLLLDAIKPFWKQAEYSGPHYSTNRKTKGFPNCPTDMDGMRRALANIPVEDFESLKDPEPERKLPNNQKQKRKSSISMCPCGSASAKGCTKDACGKCCEGPCERHKKKQRR